MKKTILTSLLNLMLLLIFAQDQYIELYEEAMQNVKDNQCEAAVEKFKVIIDEAENSKMLKGAYIFNSQCLRKLGKFNESIASIDKAIEIDPEDLASYFDKIHVLEEMEEYNKIIKEGERILKMKPDNQTKSDCYYYLGRSYLALDQPTDAIKQFNAGIKLNKADAPLYFYRAFAFEMENKAEKAIDDYSAAIELNPEFGEAYARLGFLKINKIIDENHGTYINVLGREACADLQKAMEFGINVKETMDIYCEGLKL